MLPQRVVKSIREYLPDDGILTLDNGVYKIWFARNYKAYGPNTLLLDNNRKCNAAEIKNLLELGADTEAKDEDGNTALIWSARRNNPECLRVLLEAGANYLACAKVRYVNPCMGVCTYI